MSASRFSLNLSNITTERLICPIGTYPARIAKADVRTGNKDGRNWMMLNLTLAINDNEVAAFLNQDEPKVFYTIGVSFDKETELVAVNNPDLGALLATLDLKLDMEAFQEGTENAETAWEFAQLLFTNVCNALPGYDLLINVAHKPHYQDKSRMEAVVTKVARLD